MEGSDKVYDINLAANCALAPTSCLIAYDAAQRVEGQPRNDNASYAGCIRGASKPGEALTLLKA